MVFEQTAPYFVGSDVIGGWSEEGDESSRAYPTCSLPPVPVTTTGHPVWTPRRHFPVGERLGVAS